MLLLAVLQTQPARAEDTAARVAAALDAGIAEARVFLTCSSFDRQSYDALTVMWQDTVADTLTFLAEKGVSPPNLEAFAASAEPDALLPGPETSFAEARELCESHPNWRRDFQVRFGPSLPGAIREVFGE